MADQPEDPPIGTAQNAADVARKAEREEAEKAEIAAMCGGSQWTEEERKRLSGFAPVRMVSLAEMRELYPDAPATQNRRK